MARKLIAFPWYGGKYTHLKWLLPLLPQCRHYVEPFGGSAAVLLNREPSPLETYNDLDGELVNFFRVLRESPEALVETLTLTPFAREEYRTAVLAVPSAGSDLERARRFFVRARQSFGGQAQANKPNSWRFATTATNRGLSAVMSTWLGSIPLLAEIASRLRMVQIENRSALDVVRLYDTPETLFYCDPPYVLSSREKASRTQYQSEMTDQDHADLAHALTRVRGRVAVSGYDSPLYAEAYGGWHCVRVPMSCRFSQGRVKAGSPRIEVLWTNYDPSERKEVAA